MVGPKITKSGVGQGSKKDDIKRVTRSSTRRTTAPNTKTARQHESDVEAATNTPSTPSESIARDSSKPDDILPDENNEDQPTSSTTTNAQQPILLPHLTRLLQSRAHPKTICPSEVPRALSKDELSRAGVTEWRELMDVVREMVGEMREMGEVDVLQGGVVVGEDVGMGEVRGPLRARLKRKVGGDEYGVLDC